MICYKVLSQKPRLFKTLIGLTCNEFDRLLQKLAPKWVEQERERLSRPDRQRAIDGGRKYKLGLEDLLLMTLCWLRLYLKWKLWVSFSEWTNLQPVGILVAC